MSSTQTPFEALLIPRKELAGASICKYRVYRTAEDFLVVEAATARDALEVSGVKQAYKVMREDLRMQTVIQISAQSSVVQPEASDA